MKLAIETIKKNQIHGYSLLDLLKNEKYKIKHAENEINIVLNVAKIVTSQRPILENNPL